MQKAKIIVAVRKRPLFQKQRTKGFTDIINVSNGNRVIVSQMKQKVDLTKYMEQSVFNFDHAFDQNCNNEQIYSYIISPLIDSAFEGAKVSCFAYGQTGSGKTYTMNGVMSKNLPGLYTLGAFDIFEKLQKPEFSHLSAYLSFYEIYCTKLYDLLNKRTELVLREDAKSNINVVGLSEIPISNVEQFENHLKIGSSQRVTSQNSANSQSSRSHAILQITLKHGKKGFGKVYFIDLAGNERGADHANQKKQTQIDGQQINKSLLQLKQCIRGLDQGKNHVPFRGSKLTMCLKDSFIGFCRTVMIGNISPCSASSQNTLNTLRYADRVKQLKNTEQLSKEELKNRQMMLPRGNNNAIKIKISDSDDEDDIAEKKRKALQEYGIKNEDKFNKDDNLISNRKVSMGTAGTPKPMHSNKSVSISKNPVNTSINNPSNKQIQIQRVNQTKKHSQIEKNQPSSSQYLNLKRFQSNNQNDYNYSPQSFHQPMQIQRQSDSYLDLRKVQSNTGVNNQKKSNNNNFNNQINSYTNDYQNFGQPQSHYVSQNNIVNNNVNTNRNINFNNRLNKNYQQNNNGMNNNIRQNTMINIQSQQNNFTIQNQVFNQNNRGQFNKNIYQQNNFVQNNQNYNNFNQVRSPLPQNWNQIIDSIQNTKDIEYQGQLHEKLVSNLFQTQNELINQHSNTLQTQIQKIKQEMEVIKHIEQDRSALSSRQYAKIMYESIDEKISQLQLLKEKLTTFMYRLDDMEEVEKKIELPGNKKQSSHGQDQQLLEDYY